MIVDIFELGRIFGFVFVSFVVAMLITPFVARILYTYKLGKHIRQDGSTPVFTKLHLHKAGTPTMGGILIWGTVLILLVISSAIATIFNETVIHISKITIPLSDLSFLSRAETYVPLGALFAAAFIGIADDLMDVFQIRGGLRLRHRLFLYTTLAAFVAWWFTFKLDFNSIALPFVGDAFIGLWYFPFVVLVLVATSFSVNETDGLDGLAGGVLATSFVSFGVLAFIQGRFELAALVAIITGALLAFLWFNVHPARFFMGDTGAMSLGMTLGIVALLTNAALALPIIGFVLVLESASVLIQVASKKILKRKVFRSAPLHHHFQAIGWPESKVVMRMWIVSGVSAGAGLVLALTL